MFKVVKSHAGNGRREVWKVTFNGQPVENIVGLNISANTKEFNMLTLTVTEFEFEGDFHDMDTYIKKENNNG